MPPFGCGGAFFCSEVHNFVPVFAYPPNLMAARLFAPDLFQALVPAA